MFCCQHFPQTFTFSFLTTSAFLKMSARVNLEGPHHIQRPSKRSVATIVVRLVVVLGSRLHFLCFYLVVSSASPSSLSLFALMLVHPALTNLSFLPILCLSVPVHLWCSCFPVPALVPHTKLFLGADPIPWSWPWYACFQAWHLGEGSEDGCIYDIKDDVSLGSELCIDKGSEDGFIVDNRDGIKDGS
jgi:hypothetical protein